MIQWPNEKKDKKRNNDPLNTTKKMGMNSSALER
jgi:hypothetical protein